MIRRPPRSTQSRSSAASDVYKRQLQHRDAPVPQVVALHQPDQLRADLDDRDARVDVQVDGAHQIGGAAGPVLKAAPVSRRLGTTTRRSSQACSSTEVAVISSTRPHSPSTAITSSSRTASVSAS